MEELELKKLASTHEFWVGLLLAISSCFFIGKQVKLKYIYIIHQRKKSFFRSIIYNQKERINSII